MSSLSRHGLTPIPPADPKRPSSKGSRLQDLSKAFNSLETEILSLQNYIQNSKSKITSQELGVYQGKLTSRRSMTPLARKLSSLSGETSVSLQQHRNSVLTEPLYHLISSSLGSEYNGVQLETALRLVVLKAKFLEIFNKKIGEILVVVLYRRDIKENIQEGTLNYLIQVCDLLQEGKLETQENSQIKTLEESLHKLKATLSVKEKQLSALESKREEYQKSKEIVLDSEKKLKLFQETISKLHSNLDSKNTQIAKLSSELKSQKDQLNNSIQQKELVISKLNEDLNAKNKQINQLSSEVKSQKDQLNNYIQQTNKSVVDSQEDSKSLKAELNKKETENSNLLKRVNNLVEANEAKDLELKTTLNENSEVRQQNSNLANSLQQEKQQNSFLKAQVEELQKTLQKEDSEKIRSQLKTLKDTNISLHKQLTAKDQEILASQEELKKLKESIAFLNERIEGFKSEQLILKDSQQTNQKKCESLQTEKEQLNNQIQTLKNNYLSATKELEKAKTQNSKQKESQQVEEFLNKEISDLRNQLEDLKQKHEDSNLKVDKLTWEIQDLIQDLKDKDSIIERLQNELMGVGSDDEDTFENVMKHELSMMRQAYEKKINKLQEAFETSKKSYMLQIRELKEQLRSAEHQRDLAQLRIRSLT